MGNDKLNITVVSNSGPLIHLAQTGMFHLLDIFSNIYIPRKVYEEVCIEGMPGCSEVKDAGNIKVLLVSDAETGVIKSKITGKLHEGELHALALSSKLNKIFLTDDMGARCAAERLNIEVHGSVGVVVLAYHRNLIDIKQAEKTLNDLYDVSSLFVTRAIVDIVIAEIRNIEKTKNPDY